MSRKIAKYGLAIFFMLAGFNHFRNPGFYIAIMPDYLPWHAELVFVSGIFECVLGGLALAPRLTRMAAWGLIALLIAIFPANVHMALNPERFPDIAPLFLWFRLPFQGVFIYWAYVFTKPRRQSTDGVK